MSEDLTQIRGVGDRIAANLRAAGYDTVAEVRAADVDELADVPKIGESTAKAIVTRGAEGRSRGEPPVVEQHIDEIRPHLEKPISDRAAIAQSPIARSTHKEWLNKDGEPFETYQRMYEEARAKAEEKLVVDALDGESDPHFTKFLLKANRDYEDRKTVEHDGDPEVSVNFNDVDT